MEYSLMKGNEAIAEAALRAGCRFYAGYPITPQSEILEYMADHMEERGGVFIQGENEIASMSMVYGAEMRGGTASCSVVISDEEIGSPYPTKLDILLAMNEPSYDKFLPQVRDGGVVIVNSSLMSEREYPSNVNVYLIPATDQANAIGNGRAANIVMLGAMLKATNIIDSDAFAEGLELYFGKKGRSNPKNMEAYKIGFEEANKI